MGALTETVGIADLLMKAGFAGSLAIVLVLGYKRYWLYGPQVAEAQAAAEKRVADVLEAEGRLRAELTRQIEWWQARDVEQRAVIKEVVVLSTELREAVSELKARGEAGAA